MLAAERLRQILKRVQRDDSVSVEDLTQEFDVSAITIRRDLKRLEEEGRVHRTHGGAICRDFLSSEEVYDSKIVKNHEIKEQIARACIDILPKEATIILDAGTTTFQMARLLRNRPDVTVVTYDLAIAGEVSRAGLNVYVTGGRVQNSTGFMFGACAERFFDDVNVDIAIVGAASISTTGVLSTPTMEKAALKRRVIQTARKTVLLADASKFSRSSFWKICDLADFQTLITDRKLTQEELVKLNAEAVEIIEVSAKTPDSREKKQHQILKTIP